MLEIVARGAQVLAAIGGAYLLALWFVLIVWTYRDIEARSKSVLTQVFSTLLVVLFFIPGVLLYLILRPKETRDQAFQRSLEEEYLLQDLEELPRCPSCQRHVREDYMLCPTCHTQLREACSTCNRLVDLSWNVCPFCAAPQRGVPEIAARVEIPASRWVAPGSRRRRLGTGGSPEPDSSSRDESAETTPLPVPAGTAAASAAGAGDAPDANGAQETPFAPRPIVRPLDRFRGRLGGDASGAAISSPYDADRFGGVHAPRQPDDETPPSRASAWRRPDGQTLGSGLLRSMGAYQALNANGADEAADRERQRTRRDETPEAEEEDAPARNGRVEP